MFFNSECNLSTILTYAQQYPNMKTTFKNLLYKYKLSPIVTYNDDFDMATLIERKCF
jgi:hypothetical protein